MRLIKYMSAHLLRTTTSYAAAVSPIVNLTYTKYQGAVLRSGISQWLGIRYAAPPVGNLRFMPPQDPSHNATLQVADQHGKVCLATGDSPPSATTSEDCLFLDVYAPTNATATSKLPVFFFIQGGGFNSNGNPNYNGSGLIAASGYNIVVVTFNYRVGLYGFLADGDAVLANNGLRDQRKALQWVQANIARFGGDPGHVVLGGDSAGAASIGLHLAATGANSSADSTGLFHAAAAESVSFGTVLTLAEARYQYDNLAIRAGCVGSSPATSLACLRNRTAAELQAASRKNDPFPGASGPPLFMFGPVIDGDLVTDYPYAAFQKGNFLRVPVLVGDDTNGGTVFAPPDTSTLAQSNTFLHDQFPYLTLEMLNRLNTLYPNPNKTSCPAAGCYWRQASNAYGEMRYMCPGLFISSAYTRFGVAQSWAYQWNVEDPRQVADGFGVPHVVEVHALFGPENTNGGAPASYYPGGANAGAVAATQAYWTSFVRTFDPNTHRLPGSAEWERWTDQSQARMLFNTTGVTMMEKANAGLRQRCDYLARIGLAVRQ